VTVIARAAGLGQVDADRDARLQQHNVARYQFSAGYAFSFAIAQDRAGDRCHPRQGSDSICRFGFLHKAKNSIGQHHHSDDCCFDWPTLSSLDPPRQNGNDDGTEQQVNEWVLKLGQQPAPGRHRHRRAQFIESVLGQAPFRLRGVQTSLPIAAESVGTALASRSDGSVWREDRDISLTWVPFGLEGRKVLPQR
jgi:hypothetical protein